MKNQLKKSFSLFLAVLMLMSCWVWVAPDKAEAAGEVEAGKYYFKFVIGKIEEAGNSGNWNGNTLTINYQKHNGTTGTTTISLDKSKYNTQGATNVTVWEGWIDGFPTYAGWYMEMKWKAAASVYLNADGCSFYVGKDASSCTNQVSNVDSFKWQNNAVGQGTKSGTLPLYAEADKYPSLNSVTASVSPSTHTLNKVNTGISSESTITLSDIVDTYGVKWTGKLEPSFTLRVDEGITPGSNVTIDGSGNSRTITIKPWFQTLYSGKPGAKLNIEWNVNDYAKQGTETIDITFPTYKATFDANGGIIGADDSQSETEIVYDETNEHELHYGSVIGDSPAYRSKPGFEFMGFYSQKNADATGKTASFSGKKFEDGVTAVKASDYGVADSEFKGDTTWYAAWQAKKIYATFLTADNQLIGTVEGRYNNYLTNTNMYSNLSGLNATVKAAYTGSTVEFNGNDEPIYTDGATNYIFDGWKIIKAYDESLVDKRIVGEAQDADVILKGDVTFQAIYRKADAATYTVKFKNAEGTVISEKSGYKYRDDVTNVPATDPTKASDVRYSYDFIGWAKDIGKNFYTVDENDCDENGAKIAYTHKDGAEFIVKGDASYVPVFRMIPREYNVTYNYTIDGGYAEYITVGGFHWNEAPTMPEIKDNYTAGGYRYYLLGWNVGDDTTTLKQLNEIAVNGDISLTAVYGNREAAKYTINFYGKDDDGETDVHLNPEANIYEHNTAVTAPEVPQTIETEDALYTFAGWSPAIKTPASGDAEYYATYTKKDYADLHFYNYDGTLIYELDGKENSLFVGGIIPEYSNIDKETNENVLPTKEKDVVGTYNFTGWADASGNEVIPGTDEFTGDTYLTAQFETVYTEYKVKFVNEGVVVSEEDYHYGEEIEIPDNPTKAADVEYIYDFRAWSPDVSKVCYGEATYEATYRRTPQYYAVTWLNDAKAIHTESNYQYNAKIQQAVINAPVNYEDPETGKTWAFKHWVQCTANGEDILVDGEQVIFARGMRMPAEHLYFYPVFEQVDNVLTVTFYKEDGTTLLGEAKIPYGGNIADYAEPFAAKAPKISDDTYHYIINKWVKVDGGAEVNTITADVSVKPEYTAEEHNKQIYEVVAEPTCNVPGYGHFRCVDEDGLIVEECTEIDYNVAIAPIADDGAPTGQVYVGENKWTLENYKAGIKYEDIKYVGPNTNVIVNAEDTGTRSMPWNVEGSKSRGVGKIEYYVANDKIDDTSTITEWTEVYNYEQWRQEALEVVLKEYKITLVDYNGYIRGDVEQEMKKAEIDRAVDALLSVYNANATGVLSNLNLENGKTYVIYIKVSDREGNGEVNSCIFSSGTISYGSTAAEITVSGEGYGTKFCAEATIKVTDDNDGFKVFVDEDEVTLTNGEYICDKAGVHTVTVIDKHGNKTTKIFEIKGSHSYRNYTIAATCENAGSRYDLCTLCGAKANETVLPALGHSYITNFIDKDPDCINDGTRTYVCENNCGIKLVLKPTDDAATIAQAKKNVEGQEEPVPLTADDLKHLKATGVHTYEKAKDTNGNDTKDDAWVIDKEATCKVAGSKHKDCTKCGYRVTEDIAVDTENGHKFYREKVTLEPTCTEKGEKTKTCRYCGYIEFVEYIDALGHTDGEYRVITAATCETAGSQILTCAVCGVDIGEAKPIPALGHAYKAVGDIYQDAEDGKWYQNYECKNDATHTKKEVVEGYQPPVAATVAFMNGDDAYATVSGYVGDTISASEIAGKPVKAETATYIYTFSHWADAEGKAVTFPIEVKGDATYYAVYTEKYVNYTITYYKEDGTTEFKKVGYLHNGDEVALVDGPSKAENNLVKYVFAGWKETTGDKVYTDKVTIDGANINLKATYTEVKKQYAVTYAYSSSNIIHTYIVNAGTAAPDARNHFEVEKGYDTKYHYEFKEWNRAAQLASVESNIYTTPDFTPVLHTYDHAGGKTLLTAADCTNKAVYTYTCTCGYSYTKAEDEALGHDWGDYVAGEDGKSVRTCNRCHAKDENTTTFTIKFFKYAVDTEDLKTISYIPWNTTIAATRLPAAPSKESDSTYDYKFAGWIVKGDATETVVDFTKLAITKNYEFVAKFDKTIRKYSVIFAYDAKNTIQISTEVSAGESVKFEGSIPVKGCDVNYHYTFSGWEGYEGTAHDITVTSVQSDLYILAKFDKAPHTFTSYELAAATCTNGTGTRYYCDCDGNGEFTEKVNGNFVDYYYDVTGKPLDHKYKEITRVEATPDRDGYVKYECETCGATAEETLKYNDNTIEVKVYAEHNGKPASGIKVEIRSLSTGAAVYGTTNANGIAIFRVDKDDAYQCYANETLITLTTVANGNLEGVYSYTDQANCTCACHRNNVWGAIFRFFHKIIKLFTGEFKCCGNPDPMYG